jgi:hypothetical protein
MSFVLWRCCGQGINLKINQTKTRVLRYINSFVKSNMARPLLVKTYVLYNKQIIDIFNRHFCYLQKQCISYQTEYLKHIKYVKIKKNSIN